MGDGYVNMWRFSPHKVPFFVKTNVSYAGKTGKGKKGCTQNILSHIRSIVQLGNVKGECKYSFCPYETYFSILNFFLLALETIEIYFLIL